MNAKCAKCTKTVYPVEKLNCLDKAWHKGCFKCYVCNLTLTLKTYKGYDKLPYCNVHYPTTKFTAVADTPENQRLKKVSEALSLHTYHKQYKDHVVGTKLSVADDPESIRTKRNQDILSQSKYSGKDRTNPAMTPLSRPRYDLPGYGVNNGAYSNDMTTSDGISTNDDLSQNDDVSRNDDVSQCDDLSDHDALSENDDDGAMPKRIPEPVSELEPPADLPRIPAPEGSNRVDSDDDGPMPPAAPIDEPPIPHETPSPEPEDVAAKYVAQYDYDAGDDDEVTIKEGDIVTNCETVGEGWMVGTNVRTGLHGMLPSNYVQLVTR